MIFELLLISLLLANQQVIKHCSCCCRLRVVDFTAGLVLSYNVLLCKFKLIRRQSSSRIFVDFGLF